MAEVNLLHVKWDDRKVVAKLKRVLKVSGDHKPMFAEIDSYLIESTKQRFTDQVDPDGNPWEQNTAFTKKRKKTTTILIESGHLMDLLHSNIEDDSMEFGTDRIYGRMQQLGGVTSPRSMIPGKTIPARPYIGINAEDEKQIMLIMEDHYHRLLS